MWKYIVTYLIIKTIVADCPPTMQSEDEFGRVAEMQSIQGSLGCYRDDTTFKEKYFDTRQDAISFIKRGQDKKASGINPKMSMGELSNFKLDSIPLKQFECKHMGGISITAMYCGDPPTKCNIATCLICGKEWPSY